MKARCYNKKDNAYQRYGERGITVCEEWKSDFGKFKKWAMENGYDDSLTIDRIDNSKGYCPENCKWSTYTQQARNRSIVRMVTYGGETKSLAEWCDVFGVDRKYIYEKMYKRGYSLDEAVNLFRSKHG